MTKLDFGEWHKFLCSLGTVLLALAVIIPWSVLNAATTQPLTTAELELLDPTMKMLIVRRSNFLAWLYLLAPLLSGLTAIIGAVSIAVGRQKWLAVQQKIDLKREADLALAQLAVAEKGSPEAADIDRALEATSEELPLDVIPENESEEAAHATDGASPGSAVVRGTSKAAVLGFGVERAVLSALSESSRVLSLAVEPVVQGVAVDAIAEMKEPFQKRRIIEIKYSSKGIPLHRFINAALTVLRTSFVYRARAFVETRAVLVCVSEQPEGPTRQSRLLAELTEFLSAVAPSAIPFDLGVVFITREELGERPTEAATRILDA